MAVMLSTVFLQMITTSSSRVGACAHHQPVTARDHPACLPAEFLDRKELLNAANQVWGRRRKRKGDTGRSSTVAPVFYMCSATT